MSRRGPLRTAFDFSANPIPCVKIPLISGALNLFFSPQELPLNHTPPSGCQGAIFYGWLDCDPRWNVPIQLRVLLTYAAFTVRVRSLNHGRDRQFNNRECATAGSSIRYATVEEDNSFMERTVLLMTSHQDSHDLDG